LLPYLNTLHNGFVYDDSDQVLNNPYIRNFHHLREILTTNVWSYRGGEPGTSNYYRPLMLLSYLLCFAFFGPHALGFHAMNVLFHATTVIMVFKVAERMFRQSSVAFATAVIFALHPVHTESVAWIAALTDLQLTFFYLLAFWIFLGLPSWRGRRWLMAQLALAASFTLALFSKEPAATLPALASVYEHFYRDDRAQTGWVRKVSRYGVLWGVGIGYFAFRIHFLGALLTPRVSRNMLPGDVVLAAAALTGQYLMKFLWPVKLCAFYAYPNELADLFGWMVFGFFSVCFLALISIVLWKRARLVSFGVLWFLVTLAPVLNPMWMPASVLAERYLYLPSAGLCWALGWTIVWLVGVRRGSLALRWGLSVAGAVLVTLCVFRIVTRNRDWHDEFTFDTRTLAQSPTAYQMLNNLGEFYYNRGDLGAAEREWVRGQKLWPANYTILDNLGLVYTDEHRYDDAIDVLQQSLRSKPANPDAHVNLGLAYVAMGERQTAEQEFQAGLALAPFSVRAHNHLGQLYLDEGRYREAAEQFRRSLESVPSAKAYSGEGLALWRMGRKDKAEADFKAAEAMNPRDAHNHFVLGSFYGELGRTQEAVREYQAGLSINPEDGEARTAFKKLQRENPDPKSR
jgi:protein O-mannosyl-transferase